MTRTQSKTILVIDDDPEWRSFVTEVLGPHYPIQTASSGDDGLEAARKNRPDAIILDVVMPGSKDGFTVFCELRKSPQTRHIPIIMLTSVNTVQEAAFSAESMEDYLGSAPAAFLEKPVKSKQLLKEVAMILGTDT